MQKYNPGNYEKYMSKNPLKRKMVMNLNKKIISQISFFAHEIGKSGDGKVKILDAGCGEGFIDKLLLDELGDMITITGLEYTREAIEIARQMNPHVNYVQGNIYEMPFKEKAFDIVLCTEVLEHLEHPKRAFSELERVADNFIYITVPHEPWFCLGNIIALKNLSRFGNPIDHINHWTFFSFKKFFNSADKKRGKVKFSKSFPWIIAWKSVD